MNQSSDIGMIDKIGTFVQIGAKLVGSGTSANEVRTSANEVRTAGSDGSYQGYSVSLYGDTLAVGGPYDNNYTGATWIFTRTEGVWTQQGPKLVGSDGTFESYQGFSVSLYGDTLAVGGKRDNNYTGATWIFTRTEGVWTQQGPKLVGSDGTFESYQGSSVSLYGDTLAVGGFGDNNYTGATWIFTKTNGVWTQQGPKLVGSGGIGWQYQGFSVSLYGDTLAVGGKRDNNYTGATWIFTRTNGIWTQQGSKLVGSGGIDVASQGTSVSLYGDTLAIGGSTDNNFTGATWIFTRNEGVWTQQGSKLVGSGYIDGSSQGYSVYLYGDILAVGGICDNNLTGATWIFTQNEGVWTQQGSKLVGSSTSASGDSITNQGCSVSLYGDTLAVGGDGDNNNTGATWIFQNITCGIAK